MSVILPIVLSGLLIHMLYPLQRWTGMRRFALVGSLVWGIVAFVVALQIQTHLMSTAGLTIDDIRLGIAPVLEELLKAGLLVLLFYRRRFNPVMGIIYGFAIGVGFALAESLYFASLTPELALSVGMTRIFSTNLMHGAGTAVIGLALGVRDWRMSLIGGSLAIGLHALFNALNYHLNGNVRLVVLVGLGVACAFAIQYLINSRRIHRLHPAVAVAD